VVILPIHRLVKSLQNFQPEAFLAGLRRNFDIHTYPGDVATVRTAVLDAMRTRRNAGRHAFGLFLGDGSHRVLVLRSESVLSALQGASDALRRLDVTILHRLILEERMGITPARLKAESNVEYVQDFPYAIEEAADRVRSGKCQALFLLNATRVEEVQAVVDARERMPQKSTFFYPKVLTGLCIHTLEPDRTVPGA